MSPSIAEPTLDFRSDGSVVQSGSLLGGHTVRVRYDASRREGGRELLRCLATWTRAAICMSGELPVSKRIEEQNSVHHQHHDVD